MNEALRDNPLAQRNNKLILAIGTALWLVVLGLLLTPIRLQLTGTKAAGVVTEVTSRQVSPAGRPLRMAGFATIAFTAGERTATTSRSWEVKRGRSLMFSLCVDGCYARGDTVQVRYLANDPATTMIGPLWHQIANRALLFLIAAAVLPGALFLMRGRDSKSNDEMALRGRMGKGARHKGGGK